MGTVPSGGVSITSVCCLILLPGRKKGPLGVLHSNYRPKPVALTKDNTTQQSTGDVRGGWSDRVEGSAEVKEDEDGEEAKVSSEKYIICDFQYGRFFYDLERLW